MILQEMKAILLLACVMAAGCAHDGGFGSLSESEKDDVKATVCTARLFLDRNGFLDQRTDFNANDIDLELWDEANFGSNGETDWNRLLQARANTFSGREYGVNIRSEVSLVFYRFDDVFRCVVVGPTASEVDLPEANCVPGEDPIPLDTPDGVSPKIDCD